MAALKTIQRAGSRFYVDPDSGEKLPGVTSIIDQLPKPFLTYWAAKLVAESAADNIGAVVQLLVNGDRSGAIDYLKRSPQRFTGQAADTGTEVHDLFERLARGFKVGRQHPDMEPFVRHISDFLDRYQPRFLHVEDAVWSDTHKYAGSFDAVCVIEGETVMLDAKSTRSGVHESVALQLSAYSFADHIVTQSGDKAPIPEIDGGAVLHLRPEGWKLVPARVDRDVFEHFLTLRRVFDWVKFDSKSVIGKPLYDSQITTGSQRRASN